MTEVSYISPLHTVPEDQRATPYLWKRPFLCNQTSPAVINIPISTKRASECPPRAGAEEQKATYKIPSTSPPHTQRADAFNGLVKRMALRPRPARNSLSPRALQKTAFTSKLLAKDDNTNDSFVYITALAIQVTSNLATTKTTPTVLLT